MRIVLLGSGTSSGVPRIGQDWGQCDPNEPRNRRRRVSLLVETPGAQIVIDTAPDFREQMLAADVRHLDAVLYTHDHADHSHGIDDLRQLYHLTGKAIDCYASEATWAVLRRRFDYVFDGTEFYPPTARAHLLRAEGLIIGDLTVRPFDQQHGSIISIGYRLEHGGRAIAYSTDFNHIPERSHALLEHLDLWIVDALRARPHPTHSTLGQTLELIRRFRPRRAVLTHMDQSMDYRTLVATLPAGVEPGYDMMTVEL